MRRRTNFVWQVMRAVAVSRTSSLHAKKLHVRSDSANLRGEINAPCGSTLVRSQCFPATSDRLLGTEIPLDPWTRRCGSGSYLGLCFGAVAFPLTALAEQEDDLLRNDLDIETMPAVPSSSNSGPEMETIVRQVRKEIGERVQALNLRGAILPALTVSAKGQQVSLRFFLSSASDVSHVIVDLVTHLGGKAEGRGVGEVIVQGLDSSVARQLIIYPSSESVSQDAVDDSQGSCGTSGRECKGSLSNDLCILIFEPLIGDKRATEVEFLKKGQLTSRELDAVLSSLRIAGAVTRNSSVEKIPRRQRPETGAERASGSSDVVSPEKDFLNGWSVGGQWKYRPGHGEGSRGTSRPSRDALRQTGNPLETLESMGVKIYGADLLSEELPEWDSIAGYQDQKTEIEETLLLALKRPEVYDTIARGTRRKFESNRPRAILFEGPPGTGKTSCARVIASQVCVPLLYVPLEVVMSKYFGESERLLSTIFQAGNDFPNGAILFLDEIDALATDRDSEMHEASRRMLSVLLRQIDGFEQKSKVIVIAATNRKRDLDPALLSRFDTAICFNLPDLETRQAIGEQYARHLSSEELASLARASEGMSGRDIHDVCRQAERRWASKIIKSPSELPALSPLPPIEEYLQCASKRRVALDLQKRPDSSLRFRNPKPGADELVHQ